MPGLLEGLVRVWRGLVATVAVVDRLSPELLVHKPPGSDP